ncbi:glycosyltransferase family 10 domain-containing protein [Halobacteriovorax sp. DA5]|uniref:glycosyltransferase family 10 domain-containing protein n=1 Tax=Halobacteriovorax sp. DA5 TaxID=2067553 RepID=UPI000CD21EE4|nr:glycosyltransferase family 10 [Halobacteriovorax sp. DA5]POB13201.1 hypothetical protein C0Z22_11855 [Halobacteriovorax sp. DA5]
MINIALYCDNDKRFLKSDFLEGDHEYSYLQKYFNKIGYSLDTYRNYDLKKIKPDFCIFLDMPFKSIRSIIPSDVKKILILREPYLVRKDNYDINKHKDFDKVLTWNEELLEKGGKYIFYPSTRFFKENFVKREISYCDKKFLCLINGNLSSRVKGELYSERVNVAKWFERNQPDVFDLWGRGWDKFTIKLGNKFLRLKKPLFIRPSWRGEIDNKLKCLSGYKFAICFENSKNNNNYITEKIFDCFLSGAVPIYFGAPNVTKFIPKSCFIDYREFKDINDMYSYLINISEDRYLEYQSEIERFLSSKHSSTFSIENWSFAIKAALF